MRMSALTTESEAPNKVSPFYISFSDLMVLLSVFFLMIISMSKVEKGSFEQLRTGVTGKSEGTLVELAARLKSAARNIPQVSIRMAPDGVRVDLQTAALFDTASAVLKEGSLDKVLPVLLEIKKTSYDIDVEGHTDDRGLFKMEGSEIETNWSLSGRRASSVVQYLLDKGFDERKVRIVGYASNKPKVSIENRSGDELERARAENRRVSILVR
jgi:chemotaxis protein MotB